MSNFISYSISAGQHFDGKSVCLWRTQGSVIEKIARFQNKKAAKKFADEFNFPLPEELRALLETNDE